MRIEVATKGVFWAEISTLGKGLPTVEGHGSALTLSKRWRT